MPYLRRILIVACVLGSLLCAKLAKLEPISPEAAAKARAACDRAYERCRENCSATYSGTPNLLHGCNEGCIRAAATCYSRIDLKAPPRTATVPQGTLSQASPSATPKRRLPQGTLTQSSPTATPKTVERSSIASTQASPTPTPKKKR